MPPKRQEFKLRPDAVGSLREASRVYVRKAVIPEITGAITESGRLCVIDQGGHKTEAILYASADPNTPKHIVQISPALREASGLTLKEPVQITSMGEPVPDAARVDIVEIPGDKARQESNGPRDDGHWRWALAGELNGISMLFPGMKLVDVKGGLETRSFEVISVNERMNSIAQFRPWKTEIVLGAQKRESIPEKSRPKLEITGISGMNHAVAQLNQFLHLLVDDHGVPNSQSAAVVLHGGSGTGKTMLINHIANIGWGTVHRIKPEDKFISIRDKLPLAVEQQPSIIILDQFDKLLDPKERTNRNVLITTLCDFLDQLHKDIRARDGPKVLVLVGCRDYTANMPAELRLAGRMSKEIILPPPDVSCRRAILESLNLDLPLDSKDETLTNWAQNTHAYNGHDLVRLVDELRAMSSTEQRYHLRNQSDNPTTRPGILPHLFPEARTRVRPTAMHDVNLKPPPIYWSDIGGQNTVKIALKNAVKLLNTPPETLRRYDLRSPKGVLLYGPPGCSKTMAAQAMATESGLNFFAVKGAELLNQYVGESERAVRNLFARVKAAAPAMVFFDEIDAIGGARSDGKAGSSTGHGGVNVLTTLLNEMDGFEDMKGVLVLAATNRPNALDPALLRPGRFDEIIYVPPPDEDARRAMLQAAVGRTRTEGIDVELLVEKTEGFSGAEIAGIVRAAGKAAWMRDGDGGEGSIGMDDYTTAIKGQRKMITPKMLEGFRKWEESVE